MPIAVHNSVFIGLLWLLLFVSFGVKSRILADAEPNQMLADVIRAFKPRRTTTPPMLNRRAIHGLLLFPYIRIARLDILVFDPLAANFPGPDKLEIPSVRQTSIQEGVPVRFLKVFHILMLFYRHSEAGKMLIHNDINKKLQSWPAVLPNVFPLHLRPETVNDRVRRYDGKLGTDGSCPNLPL
jgi:hypothetical protein